MYLIECAPITKNREALELTYFSKAEHEIGTVVSIPVKNKNVLAVVLRSTILEKEKMSIKQADYALKKIHSRNKHNLFLKETIEAAMKTANFFLVGTGSVIDKFTPNAILNKKPEVPKRRTKTERFGVFTLQGNTYDRIIEYKSILRESFSKKRSVILVAPTTIEANYFFKELSKGIENYCFLIESTQKENDIIKNWVDAINCNHPILGVITPFALTLPRHDVGTIILERENSRSYNSFDSIRIDARSFSEDLASTYGAKLLIGDTTLRIETLFREESEEVSRLATSKERAQSNAKTALIDMKIDKAGEKKDFEIMSKEAKMLIEETIEENDRCVVFAARKGTSPITVCKDCESIVLCNTCSAPVVLHERQNGNYFLCHRCGEKRDTKEYCKTCGSWNLMPLGIGIDRVAKLLNDNYPEIKLFTISSDYVKNAKIAKQKIDEFYKTPRAVLLGTEMIVPYLQRTFENGIIVSLDSFFGVPDYKINEKIFHLIVSLRSNTMKNFVIQTRNAQNFVLESASRGDILGFYRKEIANRKNFFFPPFSKIIKITIIGKKDDVAQEMKVLSEKMKNYDPAIFPVFSPRNGGKSSLSMLLRIAPKLDLDQETESLLKSLPRNFFVEVNPDSIV